jgi:hypothetical protein
MLPEFDPKLESLLDAELKRLPPLKAPATLAPHVMSLLGARARQPWWQRAWWNWPLAPQVAFLLLTLAIVSALSGGGVWLDAGLDRCSEQVTDRLGAVASVWETLVALGGAATVVWENAAQPLLLCALILGGVLYLFCVGVGTACVRSASKPV